MSTNQLNDYDDDDGLIFFYSLYSFLTTTFSKKKIFMFDFNSIPINQSIESIDSD